MALVSSILDCIGNTPLLDLQRYAAGEGLEARLLAKWEGQNPAGSVKDRAALAMLRAAEAAGILSPGATIIEPTSGNTGIGLAALANVLGYRCVLTMPESMSLERRALLAAYGAEIVLTPAAQGMQGAMDKARALAAETPKSWIPGQFENPENPSAHYHSTGPEIWADTGGRVDVFVAGVGTGGTLTGIGRFLREKNPKIKIVAVEPAASPLLSGGAAGKHGLQGIGANFIPQILDRAVYDEIIPVTEADAYAAGRALVCEGLLPGISGGAALWAATQLAKRPEHKGQTIVLLLPDGGERYLSTPMYQPAPPAP